MLVAKICCRWFFCKIPNTSTLAYIRALFWLELKMNKICLWNTDVLFNSFVRQLLGNGKWQLLGNGKWYQLRFLWHHQFSNQCNLFHKGLFKTMDWKILVNLKNMALVESTVVFLDSSLIIMQLRPQNLVLWNPRNSFKHDGALKQLGYKWNIFFGWVSL